LPWVNPFEPKPLNKHNNLSLLQFFSGIKLLMNRIKKNTEDLIAAVKHTPVCLQLGIKALSKNNY